MGVFCQINDRWFDWSTVVDAPLTHAMTRTQFIDHITVEYGRGRLEENLKRMERAMKTGTSYMFGLDSLLDKNHAGPDGTCLPRESLMRLLETGMP